MNERLAKSRTDIREFWSSRTKKQKINYIGFGIAIIILATILTFFLSKTNYVPLYSDASRGEIGRIKEQLDSKGVQSKVTSGGTSILVPREQVDELLVTLAAEGFPDSGAPDYSYFAKNAGFGTTDNEFNMIKLAAMQTELANLIKEIEGVKDAKVMITLPTESVFVSETTQGASASIMLKTDPGHKFNEPQINALYNLVSKSLPNLSTDDIVIMNQYFEYFELNSNGNSYGTSIADQMTVKKTIERDLQRQVQMMLGTMMGHDKVLVSVTTDIDFKIENREETLVTPVDEESMKGIALSVQRITESFAGNNPVAGGKPEAEDPTDNRTSYVEGNFSNGDYERIEESVNNEVNRIRKEIVESPYKIRDIGIQVMLDEPTNAKEEDKIEQELRNDVERILETIIRTSIDKEAAGILTEEDLKEKIVVSVQPFNSKTIDDDKEKEPVIPLWIYIAGGILLLIIVLLIFLFIRSRRKDSNLEEEFVIEEQSVSYKVDDINNEIETEGTVRRKQLEKMAKEKPDEFAKLLRTWIAEE
ncbi:flagellar basal-body MS-ring/collar protein FliF [Sporosarcina limicola]|uniref:Flagellar M-ring protein n=1 Tax=Sporosarcina limicola TaxID=34101 RepID=A0A927MLL7_9BACL|nr:flagellar basal-body MS-ring/collar protein FliF [Sporosarcina limicola]MBE1553466.1 flagellar M-ring protein FliF [Sporosarcina limicola]